jgi:hypothetical protein
MNATSACAFMKVLEEHQKSCTHPGCQVQWGDGFHPKIWKIHKSHESSYCMDLRALKTVDNDKALDLNNPEDRKIYDFVKTKRLIERFKSAGAEVCYFNDKRNPGCKTLEGHSNHIHACFDPKSQIVQDTCRSGFKQRQTEVEN